MDYATQYLNRAELLSFLRNNANKKGRQIYVRAGVDLLTQVAGEDPENPDQQRGFFGMGGLLPVSQKIAIKFIEETISKHWEDKGVRVRLSTSSNCIFIG